MRHPRQTSSFPHRNITIESLRDPAYGHITFSPDTESTADMEEVASSNTKMAAAPTPKKDGNAIFDRCRFIFILSKTLPANLINQFERSIINCGGEVLEPDSDGQLQMSHATHVVANTINFPQYTETEAFMVPVVTSEWIKTSISRGRLAQVRPFSPDPRMIFCDIVLTCADIPSTDKEAITGATMALGGAESKDVNKTTTHICALSLDHPKCKVALEKKLKCKIVLPHWFDDCFKLGKRIDEGPYLLPNAEILKKRPEDSIPIPPSDHLEGATSAIPDMPLVRGKREEGRAKLVVFASRKVLLSTDLPMNARLRKILGELIVDGDGEVVESVDACNMLICQFRDGPQYVKAALDGKDVGNLAWLYYMIVHNEWTSPFRRLLHYPIPRNGIPGFEGMKITLSNYGGEARIYLENLTVACGATYTKTMKNDNTHLITARKNSEKCEAAADWNIATINHLWIEESYAKCEVQSLTIPKYTHFPNRTNLGEVIGQTFLDEQKLHELYYPGDDDNLEGAAKRRRQMLNAAYENALVVGTSLAKPGKNTRAMDIMKDSPASTNSKSRPSPRAFATPAKGRHIRAGKENDYTPSIVSSGSRSAKAQALSKIQDLAPDIALYEKEKKRSAKDSNAPWGGKRAADQIDKQRGAAKSSSPAHERAESENEEEVNRPAKKARSMPAIQYRIVLTGYKRWLGETQKEDSDRRKLRQLGIQIVADNVPCDYLAAPQMVRTMKFLRTLARGVPVLDSSFIDACLDTGKVPDIKDFMLKDKENEQKFGVTLERATARAKAHKGRLLWGVPIYCTADIRNGLENYKHIAEANGAIFKVYRARSGTTIRETKPEEDVGAPDPVYLLTSTSPAEKALWPKFEEMARKGNMEPRIVVSDWLLDVAMKQQLEFDKKYLVKEYFPDDVEMK